MATIEDVSPTRSNMSFGPSFQFTSGRMLSVDSSDDGQLVFAGSFSSGLWVSEDGGESWSQIERPQPGAGQFGVPGAMGGYCVPSVAVGPDSARWLVERNPRFLADITGDGRADIVGFGDTGVWTALSRSDGTFQPPRLVLPDFGAQAGGWRVDRHPRFLADVTGDGRADIVGFGDAGVYVALSNGDGTFQPPRFVLADFGYDQGWRVEKHPRFLADVTGDGRVDIVGFGDAGVYVARSRGNGSFSFTPEPVIADFGFEAGGWRVEKHPRFLADVTGEGRADIVGFGDAGVYVARSNANGTFSFTPEPVIADFGFEAGGWRVEKHPRFLADVTGDGRADIVGFGDAGVYMARSNANGTFSFTPEPVIADFGFQAGGWRVEKHPRLLTDITGDGRADIVGFGDAGVYVAVASRDPFEAPRFVLPNFGFEVTVLAMVQSDRESQDAGVWRSSDRGATWALVHAFPRDASAARLPGAGQLVWAPGTANLVYAAGGSSLAISTDAGATFVDVMPTPQGGFQPVNHVAVAATPAGGVQPRVVYALASGKIFVSFDTGMTWTQDRGGIPSTIGGAVGLANSQNDRVMVVSPRSPLEVFATGNANLVPPELWRGDYAQFEQTNASQWQPVPLPNLGGQDSGNVFVAATQPGHGNALFYGPQRPKAFVGPLDPASASDWHELDEGHHVHVDLHGIFLSPDFAATFEDAAYVPTAGTVWMASDGGISRSTDGGRNFHAAGSITTLSVVNMAGVALPGAGPVISLNTGDNDGFASRDGGRTWRPQNYGGGDNDCSWADPLRPTAMLVFTPRWDANGDFVGGGLGQTLALYEAAPGNLPDVSSSADRRMIPGPALRPGSTIWNASSGFGIRGFRPIVLNMPGDDPGQPGDCVFIRFFGNFTSPQTGTLPNNLAVLLRARNIRDVNERTDWDTPGRWRVEKHPRLLADLTADRRADIVGFGDAGVWTALSTSGGSFADPHFVLADFGYDQGWRVDKHPRFLADVTGDGRADIVGFGDAGVYVARSNGDGTFGFTPVPVIADFGFEAGGWRVDRHPRFLADVTGDGRADIVGFGDAGVYVALSNGDGTFQPPRFVLADFGYDQGWRVEKHPRFLADVTGDGRADIVGFGDAGVYVARSNGDGTFAFTPVPVIADFGFEAGGWRVDRHPRFLADVTGDGRADIVGFGDAGAYVARSNGDGTFGFTPVPVIADFGFEAGSWRVDRHPRFLADVTGDGRADIVGFGDAGVYVALSNGDGTFQPPRFVLADFGYDQGWRVEKHPRFLADVTGDGRADIVGFGDAGVYVARSNGDGTFGFTPVPVIADFGFEAGGWRVDRHPRFLADVTGDGRADIVGFGDAGVYVARSNGDGTFGFTPVPVIADFGFEAGGWRVEKHPRFLADITGDGAAEIVGFGDAGVLVGLNKGDGTFQARPLFVIPNFGFGDNGPVEQQGPFLPDPNVGIVQASGGHSGTVFFVGGDGAARLWKWTDGMAAWQQLVPGGGASQARRFFVNPYDPSVIYLLDTDNVMRSDDGGVTWQVDASLEQQLTCGGRIPAGRDENADGQGDHYDVVLSDMQFDPLNAGRRFAVGLGGAFLTTDGVNWQRLLDTGAMRGRPANCYFDWISQPSDPALYVSFAGRSVVKIRGFGPRRRPPVRTADGHVGTTRPLPDNRVLIELDDGRSLVVDADQLQPQDDGTYLI